MGVDSRVDGLLRVTNKYTYEWPSGLTTKRLYYIIVQPESQLLGIILHGILLTLQRASSWSRKLWSDL